MTEILAPSQPGGCSYDFPAHRILLWDRGAGHPACPGSRHRDSSEITRRLLPGQALSHSGLQRTKAPTGCQGIYISLWDRAELGKQAMRIYLTLCGARFPSFARSHRGLQRTIESPTIFQRIIFSCGTGGPAIRLALEAGTAILLKLRGVFFQGKPCPTEDCSEP